MYRKVKSFVQKNRMIQKGDAVIAGVSGGGDSMAMLYFLYDFQKEEDFSLTVVHVNHGIRGDEAKRDQEAVEKVCGELGVPCLVRCFDVPGIAREKGIGEEEAGRLLRREAFGSAAKPFAEQGMRVRIAVAHNRNDLAETMVHHLARGTGIRGLGGMDASAGEIIRPFLCLERKEIDDYLRERNIPYVSDSTNLSDKYTRNRIRHHIIPALEKEVNGRAVAHLAEVSLILRQADEYLTCEVRKCLETFRQPEGGFLLDSRFFEQAPVLKSYGVLEAVAELTGRRKDLSFVHVNQVLELYEKQSGRRVSLPGGVTARRSVSGVILKREERISVSEQSRWELSVPGRVECSLGTFTARVFVYENQKILQKKCTKWLDYDKIKTNIAIRTRQSGDYLIINEEGGRKKLKKFLIDEKIPLSLRDHLPLIVRGQEVLWIAGGRMSEKYKVSSATREVLELCYEPPEGG